MNKELNVFMDVPIVMEVEIEVQEGGGSGGLLPEYHGDYKVTPDWEEQVLETKNKSMLDDVVVLSIPKYEFDNMANGQTIVIGGNVNGS